MSAIQRTPERHAQIDIAAGKPGKVHREHFEASVFAQFYGYEGAFLPIFRWFQAYNAEMSRLGYEYGSRISDTCDTEVVFRKIMTDDEKVAAWASIEERMARSADAAWDHVEAVLPVGDGA